MSKKKILRPNMALIVVFLSGSLFIMFFPIQIHAQDTHQQWKITLAPSKITIDPLDEERFFNSVTIGVQYNRTLIPNIDGVISMSFLQAIETRGGKHSDPLDQALDRFHKSFFNLDAGVDLIPVRFSSSSDLRFGIGSGLRRRMEVRANFATSVSSEVVVIDQYKKSWDFGGYTYLEYSQAIHRNWLLALRGRLRTYQEGDSVFSVEFSIGQTF